MAARRILVLDAVRLTAYLWAGGSVGSEEEFAPDTQGLLNFRTYLNRHRSSLFYLLAEVAEEGFHPEDIPFIRGRDRIALIKRKLSQYYYGTGLTVALSQGRLKEGRRDERMVFAALTRPQHFEPWLEALKDAAAAVAGVYSLPQAIGGLATLFSREHRRLLLITLTRGGLRQTFFEDTRLRFSRLTVLGSVSMGAAAHTCTLEAAKIYQYLTGHRLLAPGAPLSVLVLAHPRDADAFREQCRDSDELRFEFLDLVSVGKRCGLKTALSESHGEALFAHLLMRNPPPAQFAHDDTRRFFQMQRLRFALNGSGLAILAACLLFAAKQFHDIYRFKASTELLRVQNEGSERKYRALLDARPQLPMSAENLRTLIDQYEGLVRSSPGPEAMFRRLGVVLQDFPLAELDRLDWKVVANGEDLMDKRAGKNRPSVQTANSAGPFAVVDIHGRLPQSTEAKQRNQLAVIDGLAERLRADPTLEVQILRRPFDADSDQLLQGNGEAGSAVPKFALRVRQSF